MTVAEWAFGHRRSLLFLLALLVAGGAVSAFILPVALFPHVQFPLAAIDIDAGDRPAERMAIEVTGPVEEEVRAISGVRGLRSTTSRGSAEIVVSFAWGEDMDAAFSHLEGALARLASRLPAGTVSNVRRKEPTMFPAMAYSLTSDRRSLTELRRLAYYDIRPALAATGGVARISIQGGTVEEIEVVVDPAKLAAFGLTMAELSSGLAAANVQEAVGRIEDRGKLFLVMNDSTLNDLDQLRAVAVRAGPDGVVRLGMIAAVRASSAPDWTRVNADGHPAVIIQVFQQPTGNTIAMADALAEALAGVRHRLPADVAIATWYDQSELIRASAASVRDAVLIGAALAAVVLVLFLDSLTITIIAALTIPAVLTTTALLLLVCGQSFNIMSLGGMAAAVGLIVDDAIVMVEHIMRRVQEGRTAQRREMLASAWEFTRPLTVSSAATIIIFAPLGFLSGVTGAFFKVLSLTMAASLVVSFLVAWLVVPVAVVLLFDASSVIAQRCAPMASVQRAYRWLVRGVLIRPWLVLLLVVPVVGCGALAYLRIGSGFMPHMDEGGFIIDYVAPPGTSLTITDQQLRLLEAVLQSTPEVSTYSRRTGLQLGGGLTEANEGDLFVRLRDGPRRPIDQVMADVRARIAVAVPALDIDMAQLMEDLIGDLSGGAPQPVEIELSGDDGDQLGAVARQVVRAISGIRGVVDVHTGIKPAGDAVTLSIDRDRAALEGLTVDGISTQLSQALSGSVVTSIQRGAYMVGVRVRAPAASAHALADLSQLPLNAGDGHRIRLDQVASVSTLEGEAQITHVDLRRTVAVTARISERDLGSVIRDVRTTLATPGLIPPVVSLHLGGIYEQQRQAFVGMAWVLAAATLLVFLLLLYCYERFRIVLAVLTTTILALPAVFIGLWIADVELNITAEMGMTMVVGIVTEVGIFVLCEWEALSAVADPVERLLQAGSNRLRPIAMTTLAAILALLPLALGWWPGTAMQQPLAVAIISGLCLQLPLALIVLPVLLLVGGGLRPRAGHAAAAAAPP